MGYGGGRGGGGIGGGGAQFYQPKILYPGKSEVLQYLLQLIYDEAARRRMSKVQVTSGTNAAAQLRPNEETLFDPLGAQHQ